MAEVSEFNLNADGSVDTSTGLYSGEPEDRSVDPALVTFVAGGFMAAAAGGLAVFVALSTPAENVQKPEIKAAPIVQTLEP
ncbi:MAG: hypothetical protein WCY57_01920 [Micavibrio sp.]